MYISCAHLAGGSRDPCPFLLQPKLCPQTLRPIQKKRFENQFKKQKNPSERCTNSILLKFSNTTLRRISVVLTSKINLFTLTFT